MAITVSEFLGMALENTFEFSVYDFSKGKGIFESRDDEELPTDIGDMFVESWNVNNGRIELNVDSGDE